MAKVSVKGSMRCRGQWPHKYKWIGTRATVRARAKVRARAMVRTGLPAG